MCGISGLVNCGNRRVLQRMAAIQRHRGPDDGGIWDFRSPDGSYIGLGNRRLAIIDLSPGGHMPMCNEDGSLWITYNGEVYNFRELRADLHSKGHRFRSETDTEVVLRLYEQEGSECVKRMKGMFALAICDLRSGTPTLFIARDRFGIKPLYYLQQGERLAFASEIKALLEVPGIAAEMDSQGLHRYLTFLWVPEPETIFRRIRKLPAGHYGTFRAGELRLTKYWELDFPRADHHFPLAEKELALQIRERFHASVESQMVCDVRVGAFLSAGVDSSSIVACTSRTRTKPVRTYTITFPKKYRRGENALDDPGVATRTARAFGCEHQTITVEPQVAELLPKLTWHMDEPTADPAIITAYLVCREAQKNSTVLLSGVGGDELFAGYRKHVAHRWAQRYQKLPVLARRGAEKFAASLPSARGSRLKGASRLARKMAACASLPGREGFVRNCTYFTDEQKLSLYSPDFLRETSDLGSSDLHFARFEEVRDADFLNQMLYLDTKIFMPSLNLNYNDKMSMASSVEVRVPFLDHELAEFVAWNVPPQLKLRGWARPQTKYIFREAMKDLLPDEVLRQPKAGFAAPVDYWIAHDLKEMTDDLLSEKRIRERGLFRPETVARYIKEHRQGGNDWSMQIWQFLTLEIWMQTFVDGAIERSSSRDGLRLATA